MVSYKHPEGGYGWVIVIANAITYFITLSIIQCFGLILKDTFIEMNLSATEIALVININSAFGLMTGPLTAVVQKTFGCRKISIFGGLLLTLGMVLTSFSHNFATIVISYGIITSLGAQISESTQRLAISQYFKVKRSLVTGFIMTTAGFGPILIPQLFRFLLKIYSTNQVILIYGGMCSHVLVAAVLMQPVEWHIKEKGTPEEKLEMTAFEGEARQDKNLCHKVVDNISKIFDLDLLKDPIFDNIVIGLALASFAELNFTLLIPFILHDFDLNTGQIATFLSTLGVADMISRFVSPYVGYYLKKNSRLMYASSLVILMLIKFLILLSNNFYILLVIGFTLGMAKGIRKVYMWLVIPDYVPLEKLPSANGIDMLARGCCVLFGGAILGVLRDTTGSYAICIVVMNCVTILTIFMWGVEATIVKYKRRSLAYKAKGGLAM